MAFKTANLCDQFPDEIQVADPLLHDYGGIHSFGGKIVTIDVYEDSALIREMLESPGEARVLVIDGGASTQRALLGSRLTSLAQRNNWAGILVHGAIRNVEEVRRIAVGVKALATAPMASRQQGRGITDRPVHFAGVTFRPGHYVYSDQDGIVVAARDLLDAQSSGAP